MSSDERPSRDYQVGQLFTWEKDQNFRYVNCSESYAMAAGQDSPHAMIGKTDDQMPWRQLADYFRAGDQAILDGQGLERLLVQEKEIMADRTADILVTERQLLDRSGKCIGVIGHFVDISGHILVKTREEWALSDSGTICLGEKFDNIELTKEEVRVMEQYISNLSAKEIGRKLEKSHRTIEAQIESIKKKLQCKSKADVVAIAMRSGIHWEIYNGKSCLKKIV